MSDRLHHGTCVAISGHGVIIRGPSGSGKSDLALRLIHQCPSARLVADDQVFIEEMPDGPWCHTPQTIYGRIEIRGLGIMRLPVETPVPLVLAVDLVSERAAVERLPQPSFAEIAGVELPRLALYPFDHSAAIKVQLAAETIVKHGFLDHGAKDNDPAGG